MTPFVTVVMPVRNEADFIRRSLGSVLAQDYLPARMEVIVADGRSDDDTRRVVEEMAEACAASADLHVTIVDNEKRTVPAALNAAIARARGEIIVRVDGHCEIEPDYVRRCVDALERTGADNVGGLQRPAAKSWVERAVASATSSVFGVGGARFRYSERPGWVDTVYLGAYRRDVFSRIGGFDEELVRNQDDEFNFRLIQQGGRCWLDPSIRSTYYPRSSYRTLWRQYYEYGMYKVRVMQKRRALASIRHIIPPIFVLGVLGSLALGLLTRRWQWTLVVTGPYAAVNGAASVLTARRDPTTLVLLPLTFATLHLAYGVGFLHGLWRWRDRFRERRD